MLKEKVKEIEKECKELMNMCTKELMTPETIAEMDDTGLIALQRCFKLMNTSMEIMVTQAEMMDDMNDKLDKLLELMEAKG